MIKRINKFSEDEDGAVTVDWVVLTAAVVGLAGAVAVSIQGGTGSVGTAVSSHLSGTTADAGF